MSERDFEPNTTFCKHAGDCTRAYFNECPFGGPLETPTKAELDNPKSVCWRFELEARK